MFWLSIFPSDSTYIKQLYWLPMTKSTVTTRISAAFLAAVLVAGTIALSFPSFMLGAQAEPYFGMDKKYDNYGSDHDSYGKDSYGMDKSYPPKQDNSYDKKPYPPRDDYGKDSYDKKPYGNTYGQDYPSYKPVYKKDPYVKDQNYDKSKDSSSVSIKKIKCNNINVNLNSIDVNFGNPTPQNGAANGAIGGALGDQGADTVAASGLMNDGRDGKKVIVDKENSFTYVCINNNNNVGAGNATDNNATDACEDCFAQNLNATQFAELQANLTTRGGIDIQLGPIGGPITIPPITITSLTQLCALIDVNPLLINTILVQATAGLDLTEAQFELLEDCIELALGIDDGPR